MTRKRCGVTSGSGPPGTVHRRSSTTSIGMLLLQAFDTCEVGVPESTTSCLTWRSTPSDNADSHLVWPHSIGHRLIADSWRTGPLSLVRSRPSPSRLLQRVAGRSDSKD